MEPGHPAARQPGATGRRAVQGNAEREASAVASVTVRASFTDGTTSTCDEVECVVENDDEAYPDRMSDMEAVAVRGFIAAHREVRDVRVDDPEPTIVQFVEDEQGS